jgi:hypothetical protein
LGGILTPVEHKPEGIGRRNLGDLPDLRWIMVRQDKSLPIFAVHSQAITQE